MTQPSPPAVIETLEGQISVSWLVLLLTIHLWTDRERLLSWLASLNVKSIVVCGEAQENKSETLMKMVAEVKLQNLKRAWDAVLVLYVPIFVLWICFCMLPGSTKNLPDVCQALVTHSACYGVMLFFKFGPFTTWPSHSVTVAQTLFYISFLVRILMLQNPAIFFGFGGARLTLRLMVGIGTLDHRRSAYWSLAFMAANVYKHGQLSQAVEAMQVPVAFVWLNEIGSSCCVWFAVYSVEMLIRDRLLAQMEARSMASEASGIRRLLSVLCDAEVQLGPDLFITGEQGRLSRLLSMGFGSHSSKSLEGADFARYLAEDDRPRFLTFIESTVSLMKDDFQADGRQPSPPPSSLHVHFRDAANVLFSAELFHVCLHDLQGQPAHLIGICEGESRGPPLAENLGSRSDPPLYDSQPSGSATSKQLKSPRMPTCLDSSSEASSGSSRGRKALKRMAAGLRCLKSIQFSCDVFNPDMPVEACTFRFEADEGKSKQDLALPLLINCISEESRKRFSDWIFCKVNEFCNNGESEPMQANLEGISVHLPSTPNNLLLSAEAQIEGVQECSKHDSDDDDSEASAEFFQFTVTLHSFSPVLKPDRSKLPVITESM